METFPVVYRFGRLSHYVAARPGARRNSYNTARRSRAHHPEICTYPGAFVPLCPNSANRPMERSTIKEVLDNEALTGTTVTVAGWVRTFRNDRFIALNDGSTIRNLQCVIDQEQVDAATRGTLHHQCRRTMHRRAGRFTRQRPTRGAEGEFRGRVWAIATPRSIPYNPRNTAWNSFGRMRTCASAPTPSARYFACGTR